MRELRQTVVSFRARDKAPIDVGLLTGGVFGAGGLIMTAILAARWGRRLPPPGRDAAGRPVALRPAP